MENRKGDKRIVCVQCNSEFAREGEHFRLISKPNAATPATAAVAPPVQAPKATAAVVPAQKTAQSAVEDDEEPDYDEYGAPLPCGSPTAR